MVSGAGFDSEWVNMHHKCLYGGSHRSGDAYPDACF